MTARFFSFVACVLALWLAVPAQAQPANNIAAALVAETARPAAGRTVMLAIDFKPKPGWHGYWKNPGDAGLSAGLEWALPTGVKAGDPRYPVPERLVIAGLMNHVYEGPHALLVPLDIPAGLAPGTRLPVRLDAEWLACTDEICVPERGRLALDLTVGDGPVNAADRARFDLWRSRLPRPLGSPASFAVEGNRMRIGIPLPASVAVNDPWFFAATENAVAYAAPQRITRNGDTLVIETGFAGSAPAALDGVLAIGAHSGLEIAARPGTVPAAGDAPGGAAIAWPTILLALGGALLGGLILNVMPCVFPVISLKALSLARAGGDARVARREALAYAAGVILACLALGGALLALRASGTAVGWAFQLQEPRVVLLLLLLAAAIALNLLGLFELPAISGGGELAARKGASGAFWTGALAAFVATPCTGPFMGAALGAALVLPTWAALAIFAGLGLGLALPFLALGFVPAFRRLLPRPGAWMATFQRILAVPMALTALALVWLLGRQGGEGALLAGLAAVAVLTGILWWAGRRQKAGRTALPATGLALASAALVALVLPVAPPSAATAAAGVLSAKPFSEAELQRLRGAGTPVFVYFTADWCISCKVNEKAAIEREDVAKAFAANRVAVLRGDWTNGEAEIGRFLESQGRSGVPLYLWYAKGTAEPQVLPQVLTPGTLTALKP